MKVYKGFEIAKPTICIDGLTKDDVYRASVYMCGYVTLNEKDDDDYQISYYSGGEDNNCYFCFYARDNRFIARNNMSITRSYLDTKRMMAKLENIYDQLMELLGKKGS